MGLIILLGCIAFTFSIIAPRCKYKKMRTVLEVISSLIFAIMLIILFIYLYIHYNPEIDIPKPFLDFYNIIK